jgi:NADPH:quinone reductase-like Zn-dependent oxidoreductase
MPTHWGADYGINHHRQKTAQEVVKSLKPGGKLVTCGATSGAKAAFDLRVLFARQLYFLGSYMGTMGELHEVLSHLFADGLKPVVDRSFRLEDVRAAHGYLEKGKMFGKIVLNP